MAIQSIVADYTNFILPEYCFDKKFDQYYFLENSILGGSDEKYFFQFLNRLERGLKNVSNSKQKWTLFCPKETSLSSQQVFVEDDLLSIEKLFIQYRKEEPIFFSGTFHLFWMAFNDKIQVYAVFDSELIIVGVDNEGRKIELKDVVANESIAEYFFESLSRYLNGYPSHITGITEDQKAYVISHFTN